MNEARSDLREWHEYEGALGNPWVRDIQLRSVDRPASIEEDVDIHSAGPVLECGAAFQFSLDALGQAQQLKWSQPCCSAAHEVQKRWLAGMANRLRLVDARGFKKSYVLRKRPERRA